MKAAGLIVDIQASVTCSTCIYLIQWGILVQNEREWHPFNYIHSTQTPALTVTLQPAESMLLIRVYWMGTSLIISMCAPWHVRRAWLPLIIKLLLLTEHFFTFTFALTQEQRVMRSLLSLQPLEANHKIDTSILLYCGFDLISLQGYILWSPSLWLSPFITWMGRGFVHLI